MFTVSGTREPPTPLDESSCRYSFPHFSSSSALVPVLHGRARHTAVRAEHAAVAGGGAKRSLARRAGPEKQTPVGGHLDLGVCPALRTREGGGGSNVGHGPELVSGCEGTPTLAVGCVRLSTDVTRGSNRTTAWQGLVRRLHPIQGVLHGLRAGHTRHAPPERPADRTWARRRPRPPFAEPAGLVHTKRRETRPPATGSRWQPTRPASPPPAASRALRTRRESGSHNPDAGRVATRCMRRSRAPRRRNPRRSTGRAPGPSGSRSTPRRCPDSPLQAESCSRPRRRGRSR